MSFVRTLLRRPERWDNWRMVEPLRDGRECPECKATVYGRRSRREHSRWHMSRTEFDTQVMAALHKLSRAAGLNVVIVDPDDMPEGEYDRLELDGQAHAHIAIGPDDYDDEEDDAGL